MFKIARRSYFPLFLQIFKSTATVTRNATRNISFLRSVVSVHSNIKSNIFYLPRCGCAQAVNPGEVVVDFERVKKCTADDNVLIVDVREPEEVKEHGKIPNSVNIPLGTVSTVLSSMPDDEFERTFNRPKPTEDTEIIFYCMIGKRSGMAQQNAFNLGFKNGKNYLGSWTEWASKTQ